MTTAIQNPEKLLHYLLSYRSELPWLEIKENNFDPEYIGKWISACGNAAILSDKPKAYLIFGVCNKTFNKVGATSTLAQLKIKGENFVNWVSRLIEPRVMIEYKDFISEGKNISIISIEPTYERPLKFKNEEYIRIGENIKRLKEFPDHERAIWLATGRRRFENAIALPHQNIQQIRDSLDLETYYKMTDQTMPSSESEIIRKFVLCKFLTEDMEGGYNITNLGAILFAKDISLFPSIATKSIRVVTYKGRDKSESSNETEGKKGYAVGFSGLMDYIEKQIPTVERYIHGIRKKMPICPTVAIREVVANALIHQDFLVSGSGPLIEIYEDRLEVVNPGNSLISPDRMIDERRSRNEQLAAAARTLGICEERGGGLDKALIEIEAQNLPTFEFIASQESMRVILFGPKQFSQLTRSEKQRACFFHCILKWIKRDPMSNASLRARFSLEDEAYQSVSSLISEMIKNGRISPVEKNQSNRYAKYVPYWVND